MEQKELLLNETNIRLNDLGFGSLNDLDLLDKMLAKEIMAVGTAQDEIYFTIGEVKGMVRRQKEQSAGMNMRYRKEELYRNYLPGSDDAIIVDMITLLLDVDNETLEIGFRFTTVYKYLDSEWKILHFHASKPDNVESESDSLGIEEWKKKTEELEKLVADRTKEVVFKNTVLNETILELKNTQAQLIQSEKMASLGELTAGIAHEIQNPLNFINNFSEINKELSDELVQEAQQNRLEEVKALAKDIKNNEDKINQHGKRADAIVKGMLQHSRSSRGVKELTDINALCEEYLKLAYHGLRAKDKSFNAKFETYFDETLEKINLVPQEIGRVILNLINNAFYAVVEKKKKSGDLYEPIVTVSTKAVNPSSSGLEVEIRVKDNGYGIPDAIKEKVFQPFFTTKPTGQGTGLGLSICYDIVKANGGQIRFESEEQVGTSFILALPA